MRAKEYNKKLKKLPKKTKLKGSLGKMSSRATKCLIGKK
jgi:hypothetical protein